VLFVLIPPVRLKGIRRKVPPCASRARGESGQKEVFLNVKRGGKEYPHNLCMKH